MNFSLDIAGGRSNRQFRPGSRAADPGRNPLFVRRVDGVVRGAPAGRRAGVRARAGAGRRPRARAARARRRARRPRLAPLQPRLWRVKPPRFLRP